MYYASEFKLQNWATLSIWNQKIKLAKGIVLVNINVASKRNLTRSLLSGDTEPLFHISISFDFRQRFHSSPKPCFLLDIYFNCSRSCEGEQHESQPDSRLTPIDYWSLLSIFYSHWSVLPTGILIRNLFCTAPIPDGWN